MKKINAPEIKKGMVFKTGKNYFEVLEVLKMTDKTIHYRATRIHPDVYGNFPLYNLLTSKIMLADATNFDFNRIEKEPYYGRN